MLMTKEHYDLMGQFERENRGRRMDRESKESWPRGIIYQDGHVNELFAAYRRGYAFAVADYRSDLQNLEASRDGYRRDAERLQTEIDILKASKAEQGEEGTPPASAQDAKTDDTAVICPGCAHQFRDIPVQVQGLLTRAGYEPPFLDASAQDDAKDHGLAEAKRLAQALFQRHFAQDDDYASDRVKWEVLDDLPGVLSQIDNMVSGLVQPDAPAAGDARAVAALAELVACDNLKRQLASMQACAFVETDAEFEEMDRIMSDLARRQPAAWDAARAVVAASQQQEG